MAKTPQRDRAVSGRRLRIGVDATSWANARGYGRYIRELLPRLVAAAPEFDFLCFLDARANATFDLKAANLERIVVAQGRSPTEAAAADSARSPLDMLRMSRAVARARPDVFFSPTVYTYFPLPPGLPAVVTVMDAIAERFPELTLPSRRARLFWKAKVGLAIRQARLVMTISDYAADEIAEVHRLPRRRIRVGTLAPAAIYLEPVSAEAVARSGAEVGLPAGARWFAYVGGFSPHKHVDLLVTAHGAAMAGDPAPAHLLLIGARSGDVFLGAHHAIDAAIAGSPVGAMVHYTGFVDDQVLRNLLAGALGVVLPSASEGFGLPPVEGAAAGAPVIATTASPLPRLLEGGGLFVPPGDVPALADALARFARDEPGRRQMAARATSRARALRWEDTAQAVLDALTEVAR